MSLGVLNNLSAVYAENNLNNTNNSLNTVLQQLSSGSKINSGADDAAGLSLVNGLQANQQALMQSQTNATEGVGLLQVADGALSQVTSLLNRAVTLATEASNGTLNSSQDTAANQEYQSILSEISNIGSTTTYNQEQVFNSNTSIYTGDSSTAGASIDDLNIRSLSSANVGDTSGTMAYSNGTNNVFIDLSTGGTNAAVTDSLGSSSSDTTSVAVSYMTKGADGSAVSASANITVGAGTSYANTAQGLISAINGAGLGLTASFGTAAQAGSGAVQAAIGANTAGGGSADTGIIITGAGIGTGTNGAGEVGTLTVAANSDTATAGTLSIVGSDGKTHNVTLGTQNSTDTLANIASTINAAGYGVTASVNAAGTALSFTSSESAVSVSATGLTASAGNLTLTDTPTTNATNETTLGTIGAVNAGDTFAFGGNTYTVDSTATLADTTAAINAGKFGVTATLNSAGTAITITSANSAMTVTPSVAADWTAATGPLTTSSDYYNVGISVNDNIGGTAGNFIKDTSTGAIAGTTTGATTANVGLINDVDGSGGVATISYSDAAGQSLNSTDLSNQADAQSALTSLNAAIADVAAQDGYIGAQINTLNAVSNVLSTQQENVQSAQNAVQATDYASATSNMSKYEILSQTGIAALAQANSMQQEVTKLLQ